MPSPTCTPTVPPPTQPFVMMGGYWENPSPAGGALNLLAYVHDDDGIADIDEVQVLYHGAPTGIFLLDDGLNGDYAAGDALYGFYAKIGVVSEPVRELFEIVARDNQGCESSVWPYLTVTSGTTAMKVLKPLTGEKTSPPPSIAPDLSTINMEGSRPRGPYPQGIPYHSAPQAVKGPHRPEIKLAGYMKTEITTAAGGQLTMLAYVEDPDGIGDIATVEIHFQGTGTGVFLEDDGLHADGAVGDGLYGLTAPIGPGVTAGQYLFELVATDHTGNRSLMWPYLIID